MAVETKVVSDAPETNPVDQVQKEDKVSYETYKRTLSEAKSAKEKNKELLARLDELETNLTSIQRKEREVEESKLNEKGEFKKLLDLREQELNETKKKLSEESQNKVEANKTLEDYCKMQAFYGKLPGKLLDNEYMRLVDLDKIVINPETKEIDEQSLSAYASAFVKKHPHLLDTSYSRRMPGDAPANSNLDFSPEAFKAKSLKDMKKALPNSVRAAKLKMGLS